MRNRSFLIRVFFSHSLEATHSPDNRESVERRKTNYEKNDEGRCLRAASSFPTRERASRAQAEAKDSSPGLEDAVPLSEESPRLDGTRGQLHNPPPLERRRQPPQTRASCVGSNTWLISFREGELRRRRRCTFTGTPGAEELAGLGLGFKHRR